MIRKWDIKDEAARRRCIDEIIARVEGQDDVAFGMIAAQDIIDIVAQYVGPQSHNQAIEDIKKTLEKKLADIEIELDMLRITS